MPIIKIKTQAELDALPESFSEYTTIQIIGGTEFDWIIVRKARESSHVVARESSHVEAWGASHVEALESSHVVARESSHVEAWGASHVVARESSHVVAREASHVEAWGASRVVAWGASHVVARESAHVEAWGASHVEAWGASHVEARGASHVVARESASVHAHSAYSVIELFAFAVCILVKKCSVKRKSKTCTVVEPKQSKGNIGWMESNAVKPVRGFVTLFKRVSFDFKTQEGTKNETLWLLGSKVDHPYWSPTKEECGEGKFHACSMPYFCDEFRSTNGDIYVAINISVKDLHAWDGGSYPHKIAFRKGEVLFQCDRYGKKI